MCGSTHAGAEAGAGAAAVRHGGCRGHVRCATHAGAEAGARAQMGLARQLCDEEKVREYLWRGAEAYDRCGHLESAEEQLHELLEAELSKEQKLEALCFLADVQARAPA